jgi:hypothetical protein
MFISDEKNGSYYKIMPMLSKVLDSNLSSIDVGAKYGYCTLPLVKKSSSCFSIEADKENFKGL